MRDEERAPQSINVRRTFPHWHIRARRFEKPRAASENHSHAPTDGNDHANCGEGRTGDGYGLQMEDDTKTVTTWWGEILT